jgi:hypothetical protein
MYRPALKLVPILVFLTLSCGGDDPPFTPTPESVAGSYHATRLTGTQSGITVNLLSLGASVEMVLNEDGTTTGRVFAPGLEQGGQDLDIDLAGTWTLQGETVTFSHSGETFIRDVPFTVGRNRLDGEGTFRTVTIRLTLTKQ